MGVAAQPLWLCVTHMGICSYIVLSRRETILYIIASQNDNNSYFIASARVACVCVGGYTRNYVCRETSKATSRRDH